jgi:hypothetical protein
MAAKKLTNIHPSEHEEQVGFVNWFEGKFQCVRIFAIPNGGHRAVSVGKALKAEGVRAGVPDLYVPEWRLWIEMKVQTGGRLSEDQKGWIAYLERIGDRVIIGHGARDASAKVLALLPDLCNKLKNPRPE